MYASTQLADCRKCRSSTAIPSSQDSVPPPETPDMTEASTETIIVDLEDETEHSGCAGTMPFRFLDLSPDLRKRILNEVLCRDWYLTTYYNTGSVEAIDKEVEFPSYDTSVLSTSKQINQEAATVLYGQNIFYFTRPHLALWFFAHIGAENLSKVRLVSLKMSSLPVDSMQRTPFDVVDERLWQEVFAWLKPRHRLEEMELNFSLWHSLELPQSRGRSRSGKMGPTWNHITGWSKVEPTEDCHWFRRRQMEKAREMVLQILKTYRGLKNVMIISEAWSSKSRVFLTPREVEFLITQLKRDRDETEGRN